MSDANINRLKKLSGIKVDEVAEHDYSVKKSVEPYTIDVYNFKGRSGSDLRIVNNYGDNPLIDQRETKLKKYFLKVKEKNAKK